MSASAPTDRYADAGRARQPPETTAEGAGSLPVALTSLIGREREVAAICSLLCQEDVRLATLTGPGGVGKTRLAIRVAEALAEEFRDGVAFVPLAAARDPNLVLPAIAGALGAREAGDRPLAARLIELLRERHQLLVLDNLEQIPEAAPRIAELLGSCPGLKILATSRTPLRVSGERTFEAPPLALPERGAGSRQHLSDLSRTDSVRLFVERAQAARADFALTEANARAVAEVCQRVDGLPLAIELAAARVRALPPAALLARMEKSLPLLAGGPLDAPRRLRTMRDAIAWSYDLLDPSEQELFRQLSVFFGGFTLAAAEAVVRVDSEGAHDHEERILNGVTTLVDATLLRVDHAVDDEPRYLMLETVREFGVEQLTASGEQEDVRRRHAMWCLALAEYADPRVRGPGQREWVQRLEREHANLRAAMAFFIDGGAAEEALRIAGALWVFWFIRGHLQEGQEWLMRALEIEREAPPAARVQALWGAGMLAWSQGKFRQAEVLGVQAHALADEHGLTFGLAASLYLLFLTIEMQGRRREAVALGEQSVERMREAGDRGWLAYLLADVGARLIDTGDRERGEAWTDEGLALHRELGNKQGLGNKLSDLGMVSHQEGDLRTAARHYAESLRWLWESGDTWYLASPVEGLAAVAVEAGEMARSARLLGAAAVLRERSGGAVWPDERGRMERTIAAVRPALGDEQFEREMAAGRAMRLEDVVALGTEVGEAFLRSEAPDAPPSPAEIAGLSPRELDVLRLLAAGKSNPEIAEALYIGRGTVKTHVSNILGKLGAASRTEASAIAHRDGFL